MKASQALAPIGPRLALLAMILAVILSAHAGVENLFCVARGIAAFVGSLWLFRIGAGILDAVARPGAPQPPQAPEADAASGEPSPP